MKTNNEKDIRSFIDTNYWNLVNAHTKEILSQDDTARFYDLCNIIFSSKNCQPIFRGDSLENMKEQFNDYNDIYSFAYTLFITGIKSRNFWNEKFFDMDDVSEEVFWRIGQIAWYFHYTKCQWVKLRGDLNENTIEYFQQFAHIC
ncbi:MAG: hypothetical protein M0P12_13720, partial [Paludibacteraceae bacterium]|nr:hypothetical protein [Paludibacteraceae bacterium]